MMKPVTGNVVVDICLVCTQTISNDTTCHILYVIKALVKFVLAGKANTLDLFKKLYNFLDNFVIPLSNMWLRI